MIVFYFTEKSIKTLRSLSLETRSRIEEKLTELKLHPNIFSLLVSVKNLPPVTHRLRVGSYRALIEYLPQESTKALVKLLIHKIGHRRDIYT